MGAVFDVGSEESDTLQWIGEFSRTCFRFVLFDFSVHLVLILFRLNLESSRSFFLTVGDAFLKNVYSIYSNVGENARVGFASLAEGLDSITQSTTSSISAQTSNSLSTFKNIKFGMLVGMMMSLVVMSI